jgi:uncharacterized protein YdhG (YjbR/CyaY superfamily)
MARREVRTVDEYIAARPDDVQTILRRVRGAIRKAVPGSEESISYQIPTYKQGGRPVVYFAGWKDHYAVYPLSDALREALGDQLAPYEVRKGTIRFPLSRPVPVRLIERIARLRAREVTAAAERPTPGRPRSTPASTATPRTTTRRRPAAGRPRPARHAAPRRRG